MPKVSRESAQIEDHGPVEDRHGEFEDYTVNFVTFKVDLDHTPVLKGLPEDRCQCPHWGYVFKGKMTVRTANGDEVFEAGDAFYMPPGHNPIAEASTEILQFSPTEELRVTEEAIMKNMQAMQNA
jgi:hypothetical protein